MISYDPLEYGLKILQTRHRVFFLAQHIHIRVNSTLTSHSSPHTSLHVNCLSTTTLLKSSEKKQKAADT